MAVFRPFAAVRPLPDYAAQVAALPYDVMSSAEARELAQGNPNSFLHVDKAEIDLDPSIDLYDARVYEKARENLEKLVSDGICAQDQKPCFYIYRQIMEGRAQTGLVGCASIDDYRSNTIKKHELPAQIRRRTAFAMWTPATRTPGLSFWPAAHRPSSTQYWRIGRRRTRRFTTLCRMACGRPFGWWMMIRRLCG